MAGAELAVQRADAPLTVSFMSGESCPMWRLGGRSTAARVAVVEQYRFPEAVIDRFRQEHPELHSEDSALVEAAARQWFRLIARQPRAMLALPSRGVSDLWLAFL